jgi:FMN phosphatase YigB (HAD superfamily)
VRLAIDIDSTLHPYWDQLAAIARRRFGIELPYDAQHTWTIDRLTPEQLSACVRESHQQELVLAAEPYPGAVETISAWHAQGHFIHITSHRAQDAHPHTEQWLRRIGLRFDELYCSYDKVARCREIGIDVLIDDSPVNLAHALEAGITAATIEHPWNRDTPNVISAPDWPTLATKLRPLLGS